MVFLTSSLQNPIIFYLLSITHVGDTSELVAFFVEKITSIGLSRLVIWQNCQAFSDSSFPNVRICCFYIIVSGFLTVHLLKILPQALENYNGQ